ncbi:MAG: hypothetical protein Fur0022_16770 [Anaerolineales bacterium]
MKNPYRRAFELYLIINTLLALSVALPIAGIMSHFQRADLGGVFAIWGIAILLHSGLTMFFIPSWAKWLVRKDTERAQKKKK